MSAPRAVVTRAQGETGSMGVIAKDKDAQTLVDMGPDSVN